jgi:hypothetical protein
MQATRMWVVAAVAATVMGGASAAPTLINAKPDVIDLGAAENLVGQAQISVTVALKLRNTDQLESHRGTADLYDSRHPESDHQDSDGANLGLGLLDSALQCAES